MTESQVQVNRAITNTAFSSWRLSYNPAASLAENVPLPCHVRREEQQSYDYLHTRLFLLFNRLYQHGEDLYTILADSHNLSLYKYKNTDGFHQVAALGTPDMVTAPGVATAPALECSLAAVQIPDDQQQGSEKPRMFIASDGHGNMVLIIEARTSTATPVTVSAATPALQPFIVEAAYQVLPGIMRVVLWTIKDKTDQHPASCELQLATVVNDLNARTAHVKALHPLVHSKLPPHAVVVSAKDDAVAVAVDPAVDPHAPAGSNAGLGAGGLPEDAAMDLDDDVPSPRTLRAAAERLAQYTSEAQESASGPISNVFSDLCSEASAADEASSLETDCVAFYFTSRRAASMEPPTPTKDDLQAEQSAAESVQPSPEQEASSAEPRLVKEVSCSPYKLLTSQSSGTKRSAALLGLIDDVDCVVVSVSCGSADSRGLALDHVASIPALAYVATGKTQRKYVLLGGPEQKVAAVVIEANKFAFIYYSVKTDCPNGIHQVLDLGLVKEESVIGASLQACSHDHGMTRLFVLTESCMKVFNLH